MRKILCIVLMFLILFSSIIYATDSSDTNSETNTTSTNNTQSTNSTNITDLQTQSDEIKKQVEDANDDLGEVEEELSKNLQELIELDEKISQMEEELNESNSEIEKLNDEITEKQKSLEKKEEEFETQKQLLEERLIILYEQGEIAYLDVLCKSSSVTDFISNYYLITELISYDKDLLETVEKQKEDIKKNKELLTKQKEEFVVKSQNLQKSTNILSNTKIVRESFVSKLSEEEKEIKEKIDEYNRELEEIESEIARLAAENVDLEGCYAGGVMAWPVPGYTRITSKFGMREHPITGVYHKHSGLDIAAPTGTDFIAAETGVVTKAGYHNSYGNMVIINHGNGVQTLYAHGSEIVVEVGQLVTKGETVLKVGSTGNSTGPHAHFEVRINGVATDPFPYITTVPISDALNETNDDENKENSNEEESKNNEEN